MTKDALPARRHIPPPRRGSGRFARRNRILACPSLGWLAGVLLAASPALAGDAPALPERVQFNQHIRPVLSDNCFTCHGLDANKRKAGLRLDTAEGATAVHDGRQAVKAASLADSDLWRRINASDPAVHMPPRDSGKQLKPEQIALLGRWIEQGAVYQKHWAFEPPVHSGPPPIRQADWPRNDLDRFILATLESKQLKPSPEAPKETLIRRVTFDLTGLPPTLEEVDAFLADTRPDAYERVVDRLLTSPRYGEQMARCWLDVTRYGDTHGLHLDNERAMWPYRDWVVSAFNQNLPYDQFIIWQLAGDLLPQPTREQLVASGFNRCNVSTSEGGAIDEEFQVRYAVDRVETSSTAFMGLTMGCAVCHDHKLDPISQKEFYQVFSIFNNIAENAMDGNALLPPPTLKLPSPQQTQQLEEFDGRLAQLDRRLHEMVAKLDYHDPALATNAPKTEPKEMVWVDDDFPAGADVQINPGNAPYQWIRRDAGPVLSGERALRRTGKGLHQVFFTVKDAPVVVAAGDRLFANVYLDPQDPPRAVMLQFHVDGWSRRANWGDPDAIAYGQKGTVEKVQMGPLPQTGKWVRLEVDVARLELRPDTKIAGLAFTQFDGTAFWDQAGRVSVNDPATDPAWSFAAWAKLEREAGDGAALPGAIKELLKTDPAKRSDAEQQKLREHYLLAAYDDPQSGLAPLRAELKSVRAQREALDQAIPATLISKELDQPRPAWVLIRGQYDKHGELVGPGVPAILPPLPPGEVTNRLTFAKWLVKPQHPLTARVTVNRFWQQFFGTGIVKTAEDFGTRGEWPSHPELLDWLATDFVASGWETKRFVRLLVTSATYRQDSRVTPELARLDPENRLLARGPRYRLDAEALRDSALFLGGLLNFEMGGHAVRSYQPSGIWEAVGYTTSSTAKYVQDHGDALYRRSLYLFWKRTAAPPEMTTFDAPSREQCRVRRERTNTPLQALLTMNDVTYFEAARQLGYRMLHNGGKSDGDRLRYGFRLVTARPPGSEECAVLAQNLAAERTLFAANPEAARQAVSVGEFKVPDDVPADELAAYTMVANLLLNLDEVLTKN